MECGLIFAGDIKDDTKLYRYINLSQFIFLVESRKTYLTKIKHWKDIWEMPASKLPLLQDNDTAPIQVALSEKLFGQSWSLNGESDALWRIYSSNKEGLLVQTSVEKFKHLRELTRGMLAPVIYYKSLEDGFKELKKRKEYHPYFGQAFLKRAAFDHEQEVRLVTINEQSSMSMCNEEHIYIDLYPQMFIENLIIDPRSSEWYIETVQKYCFRNSFSFTPAKSDLYSTNVYEATHLTKDMESEIQSFQ